MKIVIIYIFACSFIYGQNETRKDDLIYPKQEKNFWFPLTYVVNGTFDVAQNRNWFNQSDLDEKNRITWNRIKDPHHNIEKDGGYGKFLKDEFLGSRVVPNLLLHTLGGAYDALWLEEYYKNKEFPLAYLMTVMTYYLARWGNEIVESSGSEITSHDHIADLYIFDVLGLYLGSQRKYMKFLVNDLGMRAWHSQPVFDYKRDDFFNAGLNYIIRPEFLTFASGFKPFFYFGMQNLLGISYSKGQHTFSGASGIFLTNPLERNLRVVSAFFYERNDKLAFSSFINGSEGFKWRANFYPNLTTFSEKYNLAFFIGQNRESQRDLSSGISVSMPFSLGRF